MTSGEALVAVSSIRAVAALASATPEQMLVDLINECERHDTLAPMIDPTMWMRTHGDVDKIKAAARALLDFKREMGKLGAIEFTPPARETASDG